MGICFLNFNIPFIGLGLTGFCMSVNAAKITPVMSVC